MSEGFPSSGWERMVGYVEPVCRELVDARGEFEHAGLKPFKTPSSRTDPADESCTLSVYRLWGGAVYAGVTACCYLGSLGQCLPLRDLASGWSSGLSRFEAILDRDSMVKPSQFWSFEAVKL